MIREIKFRAWDKETKEMATSDHLTLAEFFEFYHHLPLMQFTGLKDKNGKEIYEGDIVKFKDKIGEVWWQDVRCAFVVDTSLGFDTEFQYAHQFEIIGNIYENPELLK